MTKPEEAGLKQFAAVGWALYVTASRFLRSEEISGRESLYHKIYAVVLHDRILNQGNK